MRCLCSQLLLQRWDLRGWHQHVHLPLPGRLHGQLLRAQHQRVRLQALPQRGHLPGQLRDVQVHVSPGIHRAQLPGRGGLGSHGHCPWFCQSMPAGGISGVTALGAGLGLCPVEALRGPDSIPCCPLPEPGALVRLLALQERGEVLADQQPVPLRVQQRLDRALLRRPQRLLRGGCKAARCVPVPAL